MKVSTKGLYAVRLMLLLGRAAEDELVTLKEVSARTGISKKYLEQIASLLTTAGLVRSVRGANGGYRLARAAAHITLLDILQVTEGSLSPVPCIDANGAVDCTFDGACDELYVWKGLYQVTVDYLSSITLEQIVDRTSQVAADSYSI